MDQTTFGNKIRKLRQQQDITQKELSKRLSVAPSTISNWENDRRMPSLSEMNRIARYFNVSLSFFGQEIEAFEDDRSSALEDWENHQIIEYKTLNYAIRGKEHVMFLIGMLLMLISPFMPFFLNFVFLFSGVTLLSFIWIGKLLYMNHMKSVNTKKKLIPDSRSIYYQRMSGPSRFHITTTLIKAINAAIFITLTISFLTMFTYLLNYENYLFNILFSLYALVVLLVSLIRYTSFKHMRFLSLKVDYFDVNANWNYRSLYVAHFVEILNTVFILFTINILGSFNDFDVFLVLSLVAAIVTSLLSYLLIVLFFKTIASYEIEVE